jgi:porin
MKKQLLILALSIFFSAGVIAEEAQEGPDFNKSRLTGDWGGARTDLANKGITIDIDSMQFYQGVVDGGVDSKWKYGGSVDYELKFDFEKLGLWPGAFIDMRAEHQFGEFINGDTGAILGANADGLFPLPGYRDLTLSKVVFTQFLSESFGLFFGKIDTLDGDNNHFAGGRGRENFMNQNFVFNPATIRTTPYSALGAGAVFVFPDVYAEDPAILSFAALGSDGQPNTAGWDDDFEGGTSYSIEFSHPTNFFNQSGKQLYGATYSNKDYTALDQDPRFILRTLLGLGTLEKEEGSWSFYHNFHQYIFTEEADKTQGWGIFGRFGIADDETSPIEDFYSIGFGGKGLLEGRDQDKWGAGFFYVGLSDELPQAVRNQFGDSHGFEFFYNIEVTPYLHITPDLQIINPSNENLDSAVVLGARARILF